LATEPHLKCVECNSLGGSTPSLSVMKERITITQEDIDNSMVKYWWEANPLSIAMLYASGSFHIVNGKLTHIVNTEIGIRYKLSSEAKDLVERFKNGNYVTPCEVEIEFEEQNFYKQFIK
jgi:hypothetical protein